MPVVTDIKQQRRSQLRYNVYLDSKYAFALTDLELSTSGLRVGCVLDPGEVERYQKQSETGSVYAMALRYLGVRSRSRQEMSDYLRRKGVIPEAVAQILQRLIDLQLIDDQKFAAEWIASRQRLRPRSRRRLEQELTAKGIGRDIIAVALSELEPENELGQLIEVAQKKMRLPQYREPEKLVGYLARQGYPYELIKKALEAISQRLDDGS